MNYVSSPTVARPASLPLPLRVPGQGLVCGAGCWLSEGVSYPAPHPSQYLLGHWFLSCSLPQIFISDLLLPLDFVDAPQTGVEECLDLLLHHLCCSPCLTSEEQDWLHIGVEDAEFFQTTMLSLKQPHTQHTCSWLSLVSDHHPSSLSDRGCL